MISVAEALTLVARHSQPRPAVEMPVADALGLVLAEDVASDVDSPPHDKSIVDGYAVVAADMAGGEARLAIVEEVVAGNVPSRRVTNGTATRIMTGAPLPEGADAVVMIERSEVKASPRSHLGDALLRADGLKPGQNILRRGASFRRGEVVVRAGATLRAIEIGLLCEVGRVAVRVVPRPTVAILSTGNELVPPCEVPGPGKIRNSNGPMLAAAVARAGGRPVDLGVGRDDRDELRRSIATGLAADVLVLSGGVSAGVLDLVPGVLAGLEVEQVFHKVRLKPGKPLWFGVLVSGGASKLVFGLPGNPVSSFVSFELFVRPALAQLAGRGFNGLATCHAGLTQPFIHRGERPTYHPAVLRQSAAGATVEPLAWQGSADLRGLAAANALVQFPAGDRAFVAGEAVEVLVMDD
ncbi:MAG TPA: gephyrin-like molybdotransferase Glp [Pirellulales bacterium]|nr:gephyrin-like molybdotransferase Glp [Pirellulales bacterium]